MNDRIVERVKKLLGLANSDNEHEAKAAAEQAQRLMTRHNLEMQMLGYAGEDVTEQTVEEINRVDRCKGFIVNLIQDHFHVRMFLDAQYRKDEMGRYVRNKAGRVVKTQKMMVVGRQSNVAVAMDLYGFLNATYKSLWRSYKADTGTENRYDGSFYSGLTTGIREQLKAAQSQEMDKASAAAGTALVIVPDVGLEAYMSRKNLKSGAARRHSHDAEAYARGVEQGLKLRLARSLGSKATNSGRLLAY